LGCGATGLLLIHTAVFMGLRVLAYDRIDSKLEMARILGALTPNNENHARLWQEENVSTVFECAGVTATVELAISAAPRGSQVVLVGLSSQPASFLPLRLVREGIRIEGSMIYDHPSDFARAISLVAGGMLRPSRIVTDTFPFNALEAAMQLASTGKSGKIHIEMNQA
jgi:threonine dehydrogenase-like Zn-dependent dehydrogenase